MNNGKHRFYSKPCLGGLMGKRVRVDLGYGRWVEGVLAEADVFTNLVLSDCHGSRPLAPSEAAPITVFPSCVVRGAAIKAILLVSPD
ncbi:LSM domain-containing protein [Giardia duodenalis]|uniref:LSM domain-containing protein n=1 Tax=Giardia intestinalis (strain ATCC 50803 / WB clone C6) TaxID=184922 RepID=A0A644FAC8_GIAIC|nr:LSM domain-containing protein [Giardia intestinalis]KAE8305548.1 LSM domain-containing protein [Giardia intestinalis]